MKTITIKEKFGWSNTAGVTRLFHVYVGKKHHCELCGTDFVEVKQRAAKLGKVVFVRGLVDKSDSTTNRKAKK